MSIKLDWRYDTKTHTKYLIIILLKDGIEISRDEINTKYLIDEN